MPATVIAAPQGSPSPHGLISSGFEGPVQDSRWEMGFGFVPENCAEPESWIIPCVGTGSTPGPGASNTENRGPTAAAGYLGFTPYQIRSTFKCDAQQLASIDFEQRARRIFELGQSKLMETELYRGDAAGYGRSVADPAFTEPNLTLTRNADTSAVTGGATTPTLAIRILAQAAAGAPNGQRATLHATPAVATAWVQSGSVASDRNGRLVSAVGGHYVVVGDGYTGEGPDNTPPVDPATHWAWVTTPVYWLVGGEVEVLRRTNADIVDRASNDAELIVQRTAVAYWDGCLHAGVPVDTMGTVM